MRFVPAADRARSREEAIRDSENSTKRTLSHSTQVRHRHMWGENLIRNLIKKEKHFSKKENTSKKEKRELPVSITRQLPPNLADVNNFLTCGYGR